MSGIKLRPLKTKDIFPLSRILKKIGIKNEMKSALKPKTGKESTEDAQTRFGFEIIMTALENLHQAEDEVNDFLADLAGVKTEEFRELEFSEFLGVIEQFKGQKGIADFLQRAAN